jgi:hypothetical protein
MLISSTIAMDWQATVGATPGQFLFFIGIVTFLIGGGVWFFVGCERYIGLDVGCDEINPIYWVGMAITGAGALMFIIGWLLMKEEKIDEPTSSTSNP